MIQGVRLMVAIKMETRRRQPQSYYLNTCLSMLHIIMSIPCTSMSVNPATEFLSSHHQKRFQSLLEIHSLMYTTNV